MSYPLLILDLDGVLITTPPWRADTIAEDGYSAFNPTCIANFNTLLTNQKFDIWLSSSRRTTQTLDTFNQIFQNRHILSPIKGFLPNYETTKSRKEEITQFLHTFPSTQFLIIDDDTSLNDLEDRYKKWWIPTSLYKGFDAEALALTIQKIASW